MRIYKVFPASSRELEHERGLLAEVVHQLNNESSQKGALFALEPWEFQDAGMGACRKQSEYDDLLRSCDICIAMFKTIVGGYTQEEVEVAWRELSGGGKLRRLAVLFDVGARANSSEVDSYLSGLERKGVWTIGFRSDNGFSKLVRTVLSESTQDASCGTLGGDFLPIQMQTIRFGLFLPRELQSERLAVYVLVEQINRSLSQYGIRLCLDETLSGLHNADCTVVVYWREFGALAEGELVDVCGRVKAGGPPRRLYVFLKGADEAVSEGMRRFRQSFETRYGHFACRFEHVDSLKLQLAFQFAEAGGRDNFNFIASDVKVSLRGSEIAAFENLPFAQRNRKWLRLKGEVVAAEREVENLQKKFGDRPSDGKPHASLLDARQVLCDARNEFTRYNAFLLGLAQYFSREDDLRRDALMEEAARLFAEGKASEANRLLDADELLEKESESSEFCALSRENRIRNMKAFLLKAHIALADGEISREEGFRQAADSYEQALNIASDISYDAGERLEMLFDYVKFLTDNNVYDRLEPACLKLIADCERLKARLPDGFRTRLASARNNYGFYLQNVGRLQESLAMLRAALDGFVGCDVDDGDGVSEVHGLTLCNLGITEMNLGEHNDAIGHYLASLNVFLRMAKETSQYYVKVAMLQNNLGEVYRRVGREADADRELQAALTTAERIREECCFESNRLSGYAHLNLGVSRTVAGRYDEAQRELESAIVAFEKAAEDNPYLIEPMIALALNDLTVVCHEQGRREEELATAEAALAHYRLLYAKAGRPYAEGLSMVLLNLGLYHEAVGNAEAGAKCYAESADLLDDEELLSSSTVRENYRKALGYLKAFYVERGDFIQADAVDARLEAVTEDVGTVTLPHVLIVMISGWCVGLANPLEKAFDQSVVRIELVDGRREMPLDGLLQKIQSADRVVLVVGGGASRCRERPCGGMRPSDRDRLVFCLGLCAMASAERAAFVVCPKSTAKSIGVIASACRIKPKRFVYEQTSDFRVIARKMCRLLAAENRMKVSDDENSRAC